MEINKLCCAVLLLFLKLLSVEAEPSVHILAENLEQLITSSTLEWVPSRGNDEEILKNAVIAAYQSVEESKDATSAENEEDSTTSSISKRPIYVCRAKLNSVWVSGQLRPKKHVCVVSLYKKVSEYQQFEILVNIEGSARLSWVRKDKYTLISQGAVTSGENNIIRTFVARREAQSHDVEGSLTHNVGKFAPSENLGVFHLVDQNNNELQFEDGEILVETEPIRYELKSLQFDRFRSRFPKKQIGLGQAVLKNQLNGLQRVDSVIGYNYSYYLFWGKGHGLLTGLPYTVIFPNGTHIKGLWAISKEETRSDVAQIEKYLEEGTAVNVTLLANYTESEVPYNATVTLIYKDGEKREITIRDTKREHTILDVIAEYSPVYFLHNNSHVPTTTTTTTTTTTIATSTTSKSTTTQAVTPIEPPISMNDVSDMQLSKEKSDKTKMLADQQPQDGPSKTNTSADPNGASPRNMLSLVTVLMVSLVIRRVT